MRRIVLLGFYGGVNFGDEVILESMFSMHKKAFAEASVTVCCTRPGYVENRFPVRTFELTWGRRNLKHFYDEMKGNDLLIVGGGGLLQDYGHSPPKAILAVMPKVLAARFLRKPVVFYSIGLGPIETMMGKLLTGPASNFVNLITVRDRASQQLLHRLGVLQESRIHVLPDPAFAMGAVTDKRKAGHREKKKCLGISILPFYKLAHNAPDKDNRNRAIMTEVCNYLIEEKGYSILFFACSEEPDGEESSNVINGIRRQSEVELVHWKADNGISYGFFEQIDFLISMRLHPQILASLFGIPFVSIVYHPKIASLLRMLDYSGFSCDLTSVTTERIAFLVERLERDAYKISKELIEKSRIIADELVTKKHLIDSFL